MRYGILGDVHANLPALESVIGAMEAARVDRVLCLGDLVGYGAEPAKVIERIRELDPVLVGGNHDWAAAGRLSLEWFNKPARAAILWTRRVLPRADIAWLGSLPLVLEHDGITLAHSTVHDPEVFDYLLNGYDAHLSFREMRTDLGFVGHSHVPVTFFDGNPVRYVTGSEVEIDGRRAIANVGSVGQPRDEDPRAAFGVYDQGTRLLEVHRVAYDVEAAADRIRLAGLPAILGERLHVGR